MKLTIAAIVIMLLSTPAFSQGWVSYDDYPHDALREHWEGIVHFRVTVEADGKVSDCVITGSSGHKVLDDQTCVLMKKRARFRPAEDPLGHPLRSMFASAFAWKIQ